MKLAVGDVIKLKKGHPCGANEWEILRVGMDFRLRCQGCDRQVMLPRKTVEKNFKGFISVGVQSPTEIKPPAGGRDAQ